MIFQELDLLPEKTSITVPFVFGQIARLLHVRVAELATARCNCVLHCVLPSVAKFCLAAVHSDEWQQETIHVDGSKARRAVSR